MEDQQTESLKKKKVSLWMIGIAVIVVVLICLVCGSIIFTFVFTSSLKTTSKKADEQIAKTMLRNAVVTAAQYAVDNNDSYREMSAAALTRINSSISWTDGEPGSNEVGIIDKGDKYFTLMFINQDAGVFKVSRDSSGKITFLNSNGKPF